MTDQDEALDWIKRFATIAVGYRYSKEALAARVAALAFITQQQEVKEMSVCELAAEVGVSHTMLYKAIKDMRDSLTSFNRFTE